MWRKAAILVLCKEFAWIVVIWKVVWSSTRRTLYRNSGKSRKTYLLSRTLNTSKITHSSAQIVFFQQLYKSSNFVEFWVENLPGQSNLEQFTQKSQNLNFNSSKILKLARKPLLFVSKYKGLKSQSSRTAYRESLGLTFRKSRCF